jgi:hypothetical protein
VVGGLAPGVEQRPGPVGEHVQVDLAVRLEQDGEIGGLGGGEIVLGTLDGGATDAPVLDPRVELD